jgi:hypothetical protein
MKRTPVVLGFFLAALLAGLFLRYMTFTKASLPEVEKETFMQKEVGAPTDMQAGSGSGIQGINSSSSLAVEAKPVALAPYDMTADPKLTMFDGNRVGPDCCPSPFSSDRGCVCLTKQQVDTYASRAGNRSVE